MAYRSGTTSRSRWPPARSLVVHLSPRSFRRPAAPRCRPSTRCARNSEEPAVRKMFAQIVVATVVLLGFGDVSAQSAKTASDQNVTGTWTLNAEGYALPMTLHQDGTRLTGTLQLTHGPLAIESTLPEPRTEEGFGTTTTRTRSMSRPSVACNLTDRLLARWSALSGTSPGGRHEKSRHRTGAATEMFQAPPLAP